MINNQRCSKCNEDCQQQGFKDSYSEINMWRIWIIRVEIDQKKKKNAI